MSKSVYAGIRWIKFSSTLKNEFGWDLAWDLQNDFKNMDRLNVPRLRPAIRLNRNGHPAVEISNHKAPFVIASFYTKDSLHWGEGRLCQAIYDPFFDPEFAYRLKVYGVKEGARNLNPLLDENNYGGSLKLLLSAFADWVKSYSSKGQRNPNPDLMAYATLTTPNVIGKTIIVPEEYSQAGYGNWA